MSAGSSRRTSLLFLSSPCQFLIVLCSIRQSSFMVSTFRFENCFSNFVVSGLDSDSGWESEIHSLSSSDLNNSWVSPYFFEWRQQQWNLLPASPWYLIMMAYGIIACRNSVSRTCSFSILSIFLPILFSNFSNTVYILSSSETENIRFKCGMWYCNSSILLIPFSLYCNIPCHPLNVSCNLRRIRLWSVLHSHSSFSFDVSPLFVSFTLHLFCFCFCILMCRHNSLRHLTQFIVEISRLRAEPLAFASPSPPPFPLVLLLCLQLSLSLSISDHQPSFPILPI